MAAESFFHLASRAVAVPTEILKKRRLSGKILEFPSRKSIVIARHPSLLSELIAQTQTHISCKFRCAFHYVTL